jgi:hypothetical protein
MRIRRQFHVVLGVAVLAAGCLAALQVSAADAAGTARPATATRSAAATGGWSKAVILDRPAKATGIGISALSCASPGYCGAGGSFGNGSPGFGGAFVISVTNGTWGRPLSVRGITSAAGVGAVSCPSAGSCAAVGSYQSKSGHQDPFIVTQRRGTWGKATAVPGLGSLNTGNSAGLGAISCPSAGNCTASGSYTSSSGESLPFAVSEVNGRWRDAAAVPGLAALPGLIPGHAIGVGPLSCGSAGNCTTAGTYTVSGGNQVYVVSQVHGTWGNATTVPGLAALNSGVEDNLTAVSCSGPGSCGAAGYYWNAAQFIEGFVANEVNGTWRRAIEVPGTAKIQGAEASSISCPSAGNCTAGGLYGDNGLCPCDFGTGQLFVVNEVNGTWYRATPLPGAVKLNQGDDAGFSTISCPTAGNCAAGGYYSTFVNGEGINDTQAFLASEVNGVWSRAVEVPGTGTLNNRDVGNVNVVSCAAPGRCTAVGYLTSGKTGYQTYLATKS